MDTIAIGVLGTGVIVRDYHMHCLRGNPKARIVAAGNLHADSLNALAQDYRIPRTYDDFEAMANDQEIQAVVIKITILYHVETVS